MRAPTRIAPVLLAFALCAYPRAGSAQEGFDGESGPGESAEAHGEQESAASQIEADESAAGESVATGARAREEPIDVGELYRRLRSSFVVIRCAGERFGTGFGFGRLGRIATAAHVVACPRGLVVELSDGTIARARVVAVGEEHDVALMELLPPHAARVPPLLACEELPGVGAEVMSVGFPVGPETEGAHELAVTRGILGQRTPSRLVHDALISPGSSGGPVLDRDGRVVGVTFAVPRGSAVALAVPVSHLVDLHDHTRPDAGDPRGAFRFGFDAGLTYELADVYPFHFFGGEIALSMSVFDELITTLRVVALVRLPRTLEDGGELLEGNRFAGELDAGYRLRIDAFPLVFELAGGISLANDHVSEVRQELMFDDPACDPDAERCPMRIFGVRTESETLLARPLLTLRITLGPLTFAYTALFDVSRIEATAHRITLRLGLF